jgi:UDP-N-acetylglucosamine transferase subunit ALG13
MIFVTVGAQMPFERLVRAVDEWASTRGRADVFAQIGPSDMKAKAVSTVQFMKPEEFRQRMSDADAIVAHAGMGTIITALELGKPIIVMPRRGDLRETRNDHQVATVKKLGDAKRVIVAWDERELIDKLDAVDDARTSFDRIRTHASDGLVCALRSFLHGEALEAR